MRAGLRVLFVCHCYRENNSTIRIYDLAKMKRRRNPYYGKIKHPITIRIEDGSLVYFKTLAEEYEMPYQSLINMYLRDCAQKRKKPRTKWEP